MSRIQEMQAVLAERSSSSPYPIASACRRYLDADFSDPWQEWESLSRCVLTPVLQYLSHLLLSDLVGTGEKPARLFHRIQSILSRPLGGHYVGFLRETARLYRDESLTSAVPDLVDFVLRSDVDCTILDSGKPLLGLLVEYRNLWAHGKFDNPEALDETVATIRELTAKLLEEIAFLERFPLKLGDGTELMGADAVNALPKDPQPFLVVQAGVVSLRPLLLKLKGRDLVLLEDFDLSGRLVFKGTESFEKFTKKQLKKGDGARLFEELKVLLQKVRAVDAVLDLPDWDTFSERSAVVTDRVIALYEDMNKYVPAWYVPRPEWHGADSIFNRFMASEQPLLALSGVQGTGKSALVSHLAHEAIEMGHAVLFVNAQRFTFADVEWTGNPYPGYFADLLHYTRPFEKEVFKRLFNTVPEGKQVVLFIDAINEVDGIQIKWNRFRAMELLLEWIAEIAQPKLKIVLSFRLDAYEDYDYLQPDEVPERISEIAFVDTDHQNPRKPWVVDIEPFDAQQAALLYERLQQQPESGMAPAMTWGEILLGLGDNVEQFTSNPLLFMIFLRSHHQENQVHTNDREELFQRYADKLTGADEVKRWPLWKKVIGFIKNGNITPKEQLLADMVSKMTEGGSAAFLVEDLSPSRGRKSSKKRDRRLLKILADPNSREVSELKDGGVVAEERVAFRSGETEHISRRFGFVAELLASTLDSVIERTWRIRTLRFSLLSIVTIAVIAQIAWYIIMYPIRLEFRAQGVVDGGSLESLVPSLDYILGSVWSACMIVLIAYAALLLLLSIIVHPQRVSTREVGLLQASTSNLFGSEMTLKLIAAASLSASPYLLLMIYAGAPGALLKGLSLPIGGLVGLMVGVPLLFIIPSVFLHFARLLANRYSALPVRARMSTARAYARATSKLNYWNPRENTVPSIASIILLLGAGLLFWSAPVRGSRDSEALAYADFYAGLAQSFFEGRVSQLYDFGAAAMFALAAFAGILIFVWMPLAKSAERKLQHHLSMKPLQPCPKFGFLKACATLQLVALIGALSGIGFGKLSMQTQIGRIVDQGFPEDSIRTNDRERITALKLEDFDVDLAEKVLRGRFPDLAELRMPAENVSVDVSRFPRLETLAGSPASIYGLDQIAVTRLELMAPCTEFHRLSSDTVWHLVLLEGCSPEVDVVGRFPNLNVLDAPEVALRRINFGPEAYKPNFTVRVTGSTPPVLDWLTPEVGAKVILSLGRPPDTTTENLRLVRRLFIVNPGELDPVVLESATSAEWILFWVDESIHSGWYSELRKVVATALPGLKTIDFIEDTGDPLKDLRSLRSAKSREGALGLLDELAANPKLKGIANADQEP